MILLAVKLSLFLLTIFSFGYFASLSFLKERRISILVPFSFLLGLVGYMFFVNVASYFIPVRESPWLVLALFVLFVIYRMYAEKTGGFKPEFDLTGKELKILFGIAIIISIMSGLVQLRALDPDDYSHLIFSSTISEGNFPVMNPMDPDTILSYHYGPDLLAAAMHKVTGIPLLQDYDIQTFFFSGLTFLFAFALAFYITKSFYASIIAALFFFYGGGALFLNIGHGLSPLYHKYVLGESVSGAWEFLAEMVWPQVNHFYAYAIRNHTSVIGAPIMLSVVYLYFRLIDENKMQAKKTIIAGLLLGSLALSLETSFVILSFVLLLAFSKKFYTFVRREDSVLRQRCSNGMKLIASMLLIGSVVAYLQGGIISASLDSGKNMNEGRTFAASGEQSFAVNKNPSSIIVSYGSEDRVPILSTTFLKEFGLILILFPLAVFVFRRDKRILFLSSIGITAFLVPILVTYVSRPWELTRIFSVSTPVFSFVSGLFICSLYDKYKGSWKIKLTLLVVSLVVIYSGLAFQLICMITPYSNFGKLNLPFIARLPELSDMDKKVYDWISSNTLNSARFFPYNPILMIETGRMSPGDYPTLFPEYKIPIYKDVADNCSDVAVRKLGLNYFVLSPSGFSREDYSGKCAKLDAEPVWSVREGSDYRVIYEVGR